MKILLTGASGFLGKEFLRLSRYKNNEIIKVYCNNEIEDGIYCNLNKPSSVKDMLENLNYDIIIHLAANPSPQKPDAQSIQKYTESIFNQTLYLLEYKQPEARFVYCSSILALTRKCLYGKLKYVCENLIRSYCDDYGIIRPCAILGKDLTHGVVKDILHKMVLPGDLELINNSSKPFVTSKDVINYIDVICEHGAYPPINCFPSDNISVEDTANIIMNHFNIKKNIVFKKCYKDSLQLDIHSRGIQASKKALEEFLSEKSN